MSGSMASHQVPWSRWLSGVPMLLVIVAVGPWPVEARSESPVAITGFADVLWSVEDVREPFSIGQAELDFEVAVAEDVDWAVAVAYDPVAESFGLGALTVHLRLLGNPDDHTVGSEIIRHGGVVVGQMDVPLGLDWMVYPSINRLLITAPLAVDGTHAGWNDLGVSLYIESEYGNAVAYALNGTGLDNGHVADPEIGGTIGAAYGGRLGLALSAALEVGGSAATVLNRDHGQTMLLVGVDAQFLYGPLAFKGEYLEHRLGLDSVGGARNHGAYLQATCRYSRHFLVARYGNFRHGGTGVPTIGRLSTGVGSEIATGTELRAEYEVGLTNLPDRFTVQMVAGF